MIEVKSTKGIEKNMHSEIENLVHKAYEEGKADGLKEAKATDSCSWEKGVTDAWGCVIHTLNMLGKDEDIKADERAVMRAIAHTLETSDAIGFTRSYVEMKNLTADDEADKSIEVGDVVIDADGKERVVIHISKSEFVYAINIKDGSDLLVEIPYSLKKTGGKAVIKVFKPLAVGELK